MDKNKKLCVNLVHCGNRSLVNPNDQEQKNIFFMPMGLFPLASVLHEDGIVVEIIHTDLEVGKDINDIFDFEKLDAIGFDCHWINESFTVVETIKFIKSIKSDIFCFIGGYSASLFAEEIIKECSFIDAVIKGDGEVPIKELCNVLYESKLINGSFNKDILDKKLINVSNITWKKANGEISNMDITYVGSGESISNLNFTAFNLLRNWEYYRSASHFYSHFNPISEEPMFLLEVGRGCQYLCKFCGGNAIAQKKISNRIATVFRTHDSVIKTIQDAKKNGFNTFYTCMEKDDSDDWYIELLERVKEEKIEINYGYGSWKLPSNRLIDALSLGCKQVVIEVSPESGLEKIRYLNKDKRIIYSNIQIIEFLDYINTKENVKVQLFFGYYCIDDNKETIFDTLKFIINLLTNYKGLIEIEYANFSTDPGSLIFYKPDKYNIDIKVNSFNDYLLHLQHFYIENNDQTADMTLFKPKNISDIDDIQIKNTISLFNNIFSLYRNTMYYYFFILRNNYEIILLLIEEFVKSNLFNEKNKLESARNCLDNGFKKYNINDEKLILLLNEEYKDQKAKMMISMPTTQLFFDKGIDSIYNRIIGEECNNGFDFSLNQELEFF